MQRSGIAAGVEFDAVSAHPQSYLKEQNFILTAKPINKRSSPLAKAK